MMSAKSRRAEVASHREVPKEGALQGQPLDALDETPPDGIRADERGIEERSAALSPEGGRIDTEEAGSN